MSDCARGNRIPCCVPHCRRSAPRERHPNATDIICGRCWRTVEPKIRRRYSQLLKRWRRLDRIRNLKAVQKRPDFAWRFRMVDSMLRNQWERMWLEIKDDAAFKSNMRIEGTAGELAARHAR